MLVTQDSFDPKVIRTMGEVASFLAAIKSLHTLRERFDRRDEMPMAENKVLNKKITKVNGVLREATLEIMDVLSRPDANGRMMPAAKQLALDNIREVSKRLEQLEIAEVKWRIDGETREESMSPVKYAQEILGALSTLLEEDLR